MISWLITHIYKHQRTAIDRHTRSKDHEHAKAQKKDALNKQVRAEEHLLLIDVDNRMVQSCILWSEIGLSVALDAQSGERIQAGEYWSALAEQTLSDCQQDATDGSILV